MVHPGRPAGPCGGPPVPASSRAAWAGRQGEGAGVVAAHVQPERRVPVGHQDFHGFPKRPAAQGLRAVIDQGRHEFLEGLLQLREQLPALAVEVSEGVVRLP